MGTPVKSCMSTRAGMNCNSRVPASVAGARPIGERADVVAADVLAVFVAQQVLEQDAQRIREGVRIADDRVEPEEVVSAIAHRQGGPGSEAVQRHGRNLPGPRRRSLAPDGRYAGPVTSEGAAAIAVEVDRRNGSAVVTVGGELEFGTAAVAPHDPQRSRARGM